ncbi:MAG: glycosyltransferase [Dysgonamonadaceae bacterium]|jgi:glycosyltransferase|nr:glycosyltransferase [Dysgonamonadaceae bacterium]
MTISLITACFNRSKTIERTIQSVLSQNYSNIEYIIIDGGSTDGSIDIIKCYAGKIAHFRSAPDNNMYEAINKGIRLATGDVVGLLHSDDVFYATDVLTKVADAFKRHNVDIVYGDGIFVDKEESQKTIRNWISGEYNRQKIKRGWLPLHPTVYAKKSVLEQCGLYNESYKIASDSDMLIKMLFINHFKVHYLCEYIVKMRMGGVSTSFKSQLSKWKEDFLIFRFHKLNPYIALGGKILSKVPQFFR